MESSLPKFLFSKMLKEQSKFQEHLGWELTQGGGLISNLKF